MLQVRGGQGSEQRRQRAPHLAEVLQKPSVKRFSTTSCNGAGDPWRTHPVKTVFYLPVAADPGGQGGRIGVAVAGNEVGHLDGLLAVPRDRTSQLRDLGGSGAPSRPAPARP